PKAGDSRQFGGNPLFAFGSDFPCVNRLRLGRDRFDDRRHSLAPTLGQLDIAPRGPTFVCPAGRRSGCASERTDGLLGAVEAPHLPAGPIPMGGRPLHERAATSRAPTVVFDPPLPGAWM